MIVHFNRHCPLQNAGWIIRIVVKEWYVAQVRVHVGVWVVVRVSMLRYQEQDMVLVPVGAYELHHVDRLGRIDITAIVVLSVSISPGHNHSMGELT